MFRLSIVRSYSLFKQSLISKVSENPYSSGNEWKGWEPKYGRNIYVMKNVFWAVDGANIVGLWDIWILNYLNDIRLINMGII